MLNGKRRTSQVCPNSPQPQPLRVQRRDVHTLQAQCQRGDERDELLHMFGHRGDYYLNWNAAGNKYTFALSGPCGLREVQILREFLNSTEMLLHIYWKASGGTIADFHRETAIFSVQRVPLLELSPRATEALSARRHSLPRLLHLQLNMRELPEVRDSCVH